MYRYCFSIFRSRTPVKGGGGGVQTLQEQAIRLASDPDSRSKRNEMPEASKTCDTFDNFKKKYGKRLIHSKNSDFGPKKYSKRFIHSKI